MSKTYRAKSALTVQHPEIAAFKRKAQEEYRWGDAMIALECSIVLGKV